MKIKLKVAIVLNGKESGILRHSMQQHKLGRTMPTEAEAMLEEFIKLDNTVANIHRAHHEE